MMLLANWPDAARSQGRSMSPILPSADAQLPGRGSRSSHSCGPEARKLLRTAQKIFRSQCSGRSGFIDRALGKKLPDLAGGSGVAEEITLHLGAADCLQHIQLLLSL